jgi:hypothetical protein
MFDRVKWLGLRMQPRENASGKASGEQDITGSDRHEMVPG